MQSALSATPLFIQLNASSIFPSVEYAVATRMEASVDLILIPGARGHEYVRVSREGIRTKLGIDATVPFEDQNKFRRVEFAPTDVELNTFTTGEAVAINALRLVGSNVA